MPTKVEKDAITGTETTGHEWDGIKELNTPLPKWWLYVFYATIIWSVIYMILMPSVPGITGYFAGVLGYDQRVAVEERLAEARERQGENLVRMAALTPAEIIEDPDLLPFALAGGEAAFADNCAPCHGLGGAGNPGGFPVLADDDWIWGGTLDDIRFSIVHGIRNDADPDARFSQMPVYGGQFGILSNEEIRDVADYVLSLSGRGEADEETLARGGEIYAQQCVACHAEDGRGLYEFGGPNLTDAIWLYGGERSEIIAQIANPRQGVMPPWLPRLSDETIDMLTVYVHSLGGGQ